MIFIFNMPAQQNGSQKYSRKYSSVPCSPELGMNLACFIKTKGEEV